MTRKEILILILVLLPIYLYFFQTERIWVKRNYVLWAIVLLSFTFFIYKITQPQDKELILSLLYPSFIWLTLTFLLDKIFLFTNKRDLEVNKQNNFEYPNHLIFTTFDKILAREIYDKSIKSGTRAIDKIFSIALLILMYIIWTIIVKYF